jgi:hypothetical protein
VRSRHPETEQIELVLGGQSATWEALHAAARERTIDLLSHLLAHWYAAEKNRQSEERSSCNGQDN